MKDFLKNKKILFISTGFHSYDKLIIHALQEKGGEVDNFIEYHKYYKYFKKICKPIANCLSYLRQTKILRNAKNTYDYVFVIKGETLREFFLDELKKRNKNAVFILYQWDSIANVKNYRKIKSYFDRKYSFDRIDTLENQDLSFLPLFFSKNIQKNNLHNEDIDISFVGVLHSDRHKTIDKFIELCKKENLKSFFFIATNIVYYGIMKYIRGSKVVHKKPLEYKQYLDIVNRSRIILDLPNPKQNGLTMRTLETLAKNKKLITTNEDIINYEFYSSERIYILKDSNFNESLLKFIKDKKKLDYEPLKLQIEKYELENWIEKIFS
jgi:hypothetical protein